MARVTCRCGERIDVKKGGPERIDCPRCGAKIRLRKRSTGAGAGAGAESLQGVSETEDGYLRFHCPCGRRLKVRAASRPEAGKCPDCGRIVPVPELAWSPPVYPGGMTQGDPDAHTEDLDREDRARLEEWSARHLGRASRAADRDEPTPAAVPLAAISEFGPAAGTAPPSMVKFEAGLRVCPRCGKPVHMSATTCRECGSPVPRR
jgi:hypothetical protein